MEKVSRQEVKQLKEATYARIEGVKENEKLSEINGLQVVGVSVTNNRKKSTFLG